MNLLKKSLLLTLLSTSLLTSCASIINGRSQSIGITSTPGNANVIIDGMYMGQTPLIANLTRKDNHLLRIELEGYVPFETYFTKKTSGWVFGNIIFGLSGLIGLAIDATTGAIYKLTPENVQAQLQNNQMMCQVKGDKSFVTVVLNADPSWEKIGQLTKK